MQIRKTEKNKSFHKINLSLLAASCWYGPCQCGGESVRACRPMTGPGREMLPRWSGAPQDDNSPYISCQEDTCNSVAFVFFITLHAKLDPC